MNDTQLDRLSKLSHLFELCAKMGGTPMFSKVQAAITDDLKILLDQIDPPKTKPTASPVLVATEQATAEPKPEPAPVGEVPVEVERRV